MSRTRALLLLAAVVMGIAIGLGGFTFVYAKGYSYLGHDPAACANCHVMEEHFQAWMKGPHRAVATCNDCHTPHSLVPKYVTKARNGFWHSFYFTTGDYPYPLRITERNHEVTEETCRYCHERVTAAIDHGGDAEGDDRVVCTRCHRYVGHWVR